MAKSKKAKAANHKPVNLPTPENIGEQNITDNNIEYLILGNNNTIHFHFHHYPDGSVETEVEVEADSGDENSKGE